ncbi:MAG: alpha/beta hydrolase [Pseudanabaena sp.]|jgi:pimeloyl-ACP methyl ester carboxylesterase|uniref:alpha/beta hydrolase n=1 Tax=Pseudanabaena mucicola TaxID=71190 RepID=UPI002576C275|nr:alpha/beta fold hydrolase [Pseudanabaena mucicola]MCA6586578.1 alpha/beta fold hydrolase [Pseudanabaena sp. M051S1SP1A06QC]MCA6603339.1 alpha/beta fold hydrolase [Pseudanabaena sp. M007S1SP1A06QC]MCA6615573.1 alpha/beta fold hydrolase [Pseudanabaena sp. M090S1SP1A06QC]MCE2976504.1 alpha/beta hydrolase [Pseudanabaena sp. CoA8_M7]
MTESSLESAKNQQTQSESPKKWLRPAAITGIVIASFYGSVCAGLWFGQTRLVFSPEKELTTTPAKFNAKYEDVLIPVKKADGSSENIHGWWLPNAKHFQSSNLGDHKVILYLHGKGKNISANAKHANRLMRMGFSVLVIDYRGYGRSEGDFPSESSVYADAQTAWDYLIEKGYKANQIMIYGHSLGGAIAIDLALKYPNALGIIVDASFTSMSDMAQLDLKYRIFPIDLLIHQRFDSISKVRSLAVPVLYIHGTADELVPPMMSWRLYDATPTRKQIVFIPNGGHNNNAATNEPLYLNSISSFFNL